MKKYENVQVHVTEHVYKRYSERVEPITYKELLDLLNKQLQEEDYGYNKDWFIHLSGVWWVYELKDNIMNLVTCYGRTDIDMPKALKWAQLQHDRIDLSNLLTVEVAK